MQRHPELADAEPSAAPSLERVPVEEDERYRRTDHSDILQWEARRAFALNIAQGEAGIRLAEAALQVAAEDDAVATSSTVPFPVAAYLQRLQAMADELARVHLPQLPASPHQPQTGADEAPHRAGPSPGAAVAAVEDFLYRARRLRMTATGRSALPRRAVLDHPGTWEDARSGYLNELLVRRVGHPAALAIVHADVMQRLLAAGAIDFGFTMDCRGFQAPPRAVPQPQWRRAALLQSDGRPINTCTSEALVELIRHLKRAYWPFPWDTNVDAPEDGGRGSHGGFRGAAKAALGEDDTADLTAIAIVARHRLERGIWTSPGAGDLRRCVAAAERLVMLQGDEQPEERRDLAVLLLHAGRLEEAHAELDAYLSSSAHRSSCSPRDAALCAQLERLLRGAIAASGGSSRGGGVQLMGVARVLATEPPALGAVEERRRPLTW